MVALRIASGPALQVIPAILFVALVGCGGPTGSDPGANGLSDLGLSNVATENTAAREATISEEGGSLTVTDRNGVVYTLIVPAFAISGDTTIGMYPVDGVTTLPTGAQMVGGVHLVPDGLVLQLGATLTMEFPASLDILSLYAVGYDADGADLSLSVYRADGQTLTMQIQHFSGGLAVSGEEALAALGFEPDSLSARYIDRIARATVGFAGDDPALTAAVLPIYVEWYQDLVRPTLLEFSTLTLDSGIFDEARRVYAEWHSVAAMTEILSQLQAQVAEATPLAALYLAKRYEFFNRVCAANSEVDVNVSFGPVAAAASALEVRGLAQQWGIPLEPNNLDEEFLLDNLCVKVAFDTLLSDGLENPGDVGTLTVGATYSIAGGPARNDLPIRVQLTRGSAAFGNPSFGLLDSAGFFDSRITWPTGIDPFTIDVLARLNTSGFRRIARFDRLTIGCATPQVNTVTPSIVGENTADAFIADVTGVPTTYVWDFGGGATPNASTDAEPAVTFGDAGTFTGSLTLGNACGSSNVFVFTYEVRAIPFTSHEFVGDLNHQDTFNLNIVDCEGPGRARFNYGSTSSGFPQFEIEYEFDCPTNPFFPTLFFLFNEGDVIGNQFVTRDGFGTGRFSDGFLIFAYENSTLTITFEGNIAP